MNKIERALIRTRKTVRQACQETGTDPEEVDILDIDQCSSCSVWAKHSELREDLDGNYICRVCWDEYGP